MANLETGKSKQDNFVDISSGKQIRKIYNKKGRLKRTLCLILSFLLIIAGSGTIYYYSVLNSLNFVDLNSSQDDNVSATSATVSELENDGTNLTLDSDELLQDSKVLNVMLFGEDRSDGGNGRSDTMIMMSIDNRHQKLKLTSFQRDTYVYIPGYGYNKINSSYTYGGAKLAIQTIESNFGIKVDRYAVVDFDSFKKIIDTLGGVDIELTEDEIEYINYQMYKNNQVSERYTITDDAGVVHLDGQEALWYARNRGLSIGEDGNEIGISGDDWDRTSRQRKLLETIFDSMRSADITQIVSIVSSIGPLITTNLKKDEITALVSHATKYLSYDVEQYYVPEEGLWYYDKSDTAGSIIAISDMDAQRLAFAEFVYEDLISGSTESTTAAASDQ